MKNLIGILVWFLFGQSIYSQDIFNNLSLDSNRFKTRFDRLAFNPMTEPQIYSKLDSTQEFHFHEIFSYNLGAHWCENQVVADDFDKDGETDVIIFATTTTDTISPFRYTSKIIYLHNEGNWQFTDSVLFQFNSYGYWISHGDLNNDTWEDFVIKDSGNIRVFINDQSGQFTEYWNGGSEYRCLDLADLNNDNFLDILSGTQTQSGGLLEIYLNSESGKNFQVNWQSTFYGHSDGTIHNILAADLNDNLQKDIVATEIYDGLLLTFSGDGSGTNFQEELVKKLGTRTFALAVGNINGDSLSDIAVYSGWGEVRTFITNDIDSLKEFWVSPNFKDVGYNLELEDFNQDGFSDLFIGTFDTGKLFIYENNSGSDFNLVWSDTLNGVGYTGKAFHLNDDLFPDLIVGEENNVRLLINNTVTTTEMKSKMSNIPSSWVLSQNYPNPFNPNTIINYSMSNQSLVTLKVYDILGREIKTLVNEEQSQGSYEVEFNGSKHSSGIYYFRLLAGEFMKTKKMILLK
jgi:Secretion system C-terminal sorting domain/FG-GAP-like repeat